MSEDNRRTRKVLVALGIAFTVLLCAAVAVLPTILQRRRAEAEQRQLKKILALGVGSDNELRDLAGGYEPRT